MVLIGVEFLRTVKLDRRWAALLAVGVVFAAVGNANALRGARDSLQVFTRMLSAQFAALEVLGRENVPPDFVAAVDLAPGISAEDYFEMTDELGSPVDVTRDLLHRGEEDRRHADAVLAAALAVTGRRNPDFEPGPPRPGVDDIRLGRVVESRGCVRFDPFDGGPAKLVVTARGRAVMLRTSGQASLDVSVRRFGGRFHHVARLPADSSLALALPSGNLSVPWRLRISARGAAEICSVAHPLGRD